MSATRSVASATVLFAAMLPVAAVESSPWAIRSAIDNPNDLSDTNPATLMLTENDGGKDSYLVDLAVNYLHPVPGLGAAASDAVVTAEWHRNTVTTAPANTLLGSFSLAGTLGDVSRGAATNYVASGSYKSDRIRSENSVIAGLETCLVTPRHSPLAFLSSGFFIALPDEDEPTIKFEPLFLVGAGYEATVRTPAGRESGHVARGSLRYSLKTTFPRQVPNLVIAAEVRVWQDLSESGSYAAGPDTRRYYQVSVIYYFDPDKTWGVALKRRDGEDPIAGKPEQHFTSLAFTCNFGKR